MASELNDGYSVAQADNSRVRLSDVTYQALISGNTGDMKCLSFGIWTGRRGMKTGKQNEIHPPERSGG